MVDRFASIRRPTREAILVLQVEDTVDVEDTTPMLVLAILTLVEVEAEDISLILMDRETKEATVLANGDLLNMVVILLHLLTVLKEAIINIKVFSLEVVRTRLTIRINRCQINNSNRVNNNHLSLVLAINGQDNEAPELKNLSGF